MEKLELTHVPASNTGMLIRRPVTDLFEAFVDPAVTTRFWFTKGSARLEVGKQVQWTWEMYDVSVAVTVKEVEPNQRIVIEWPGYVGQTSVAWTFAAQPDGATFVTISESGFSGDGDSIVKQVASSTEGFSLLLAGAKAWLEHGIELHLVSDRFPKGVAEE